MKKEIIMFKKTLLCAALIAVSGGATAKATGTAGDFAADGPITLVVLSLLLTQQKAQKM